MKTIPIRMGFKTTPVRMGFELKTAHNEIYTDGQNRGNAQRLKPIRMGFEPKTAHKELYTDGQDKGYCASTFDQSLDLWKSRSGAGWGLNPRPLGPREGPSALPLSYKP